MTDHATADRFRDVEGVRDRYGAARVDRLIAAAFEGDPAADALVARFAELPGGEGWRTLDRALESGDASVLPELDALLHPILDPPAWVDFERVDAGAVAQWRAGGMGLGLTLTWGSLAFGYGSASLVRPLAATGRLERMAARRLGETSRWVLGATRPGALLPGGDGIRETIRLRIVHALVRRRLAAADWWEHDEWGVPISAVDGLATAISGFLVVPVRALGDIGMRFRRDELEAMTHQWSWIAFLMGVPADLLPGSWSEARELTDLGLELDSGPNEDSPKLMRALLYHGVHVPLEQRLPGPAAKLARGLTARTMATFARRWMDGDRAAALELPATPLHRLVPLVRPLTMARGLAARSVFRSDERLARFEVAFTDRVLDMRRAPATLAPADVVEEPLRSAA